eukprot:6183676-Pleurochrysis_carterae.AAC.2
MYVDADAHALTPTRIRKHKYAKTKLAHNNTTSVRGSAHARRCLLCACVCCVLLPVTLECPPPMRLFDLRLGKATRAVCVLVQGGQCRLKNTCKQNMSPLDAKASPFGR